MDIHQLNLFLAVVECSSVTRAAQRVHLTPGAVSLQIHSLADELRTELFVRSGKRLIPTQAAIRLAEHAKSMNLLKNRILEDFENDSVCDTRPFNFATGVTTLIYQLGDPLRRLRKECPNADLRVTVGVTEQIVTGLLARRFDLGLISLPVVEDQLNIMPLFDEELVLLRPSERPQAGHIHPVAANELVDVPFLLYPKRSNVRGIIDQFFKEISVVPRVLMEADDTEALKGLVASGFGYSILPMHALNDPNPYYEVLRVESNRLCRTLALASAISDYPRKLTETVASNLHKSLTEGRASELG